MKNVLVRVYVTPDTNILIGRRRVFIEKLKQYKSKVVIGLLQIPVEESLEKGRSLYVSVCRHDDRTIDFLQRLKGLESELRVHGLDVEKVPVAGIYGITRYSLSYYVSEDSEKLLLQAIRSYLSKKYKPTLAYITRRCLRVNLEINVETFWWILRNEKCCIFLNSNNEDCRRQCEVLYGMLSDVLVLSGAYYIYRKRLVNVIIVSDDKTLCNVAEELSKEQYFDKRLVRCIPLKNIEKVLLSA